MLCSKIHRQEVLCRKCFHIKSSLEPWSPGQAAEKEGKKSKDLATKIADMKKARSAQSKVCPKQRESLLNL